MDANQRWDVPEAIEWMSKLAEFKPLWIEEPTSPDDILGHATISKVEKPLLPLSLLPCIFVCGFGLTDPKIPLLLPFYIFTYFRDSTLLKVERLPTNQRLIDTAPDFVNIEI